MREIIDPTTYPNYTSLGFGGTPMTSKNGEVAGLFDQIKLFVEKNAVTPEVGHAAIAALNGAWGSVYLATNGKVSN